MKKIFFLLTLVILVIFNSCKPEIEIVDKEDELTFKNQNLQGEMNNEAWEYKSACADKYNGGEDFYFTIFPTDEEDVCGAGTIGLSHVNMTLPAKVGTYTFGDEYDAQLYHAPSSLNIFISRGKVEIISIDTVAKIIKGRGIFDGYDTELNGNFEAVICN